MGERDGNHITKMQRGVHVAGRVPQCGRTIIPQVSSSNLKKPASKGHTTKRKRLYVELLYFSNRINKFRVRNMQIVH